jgi:hypothetical protein
MARAAPGVVRHGTAKNLADVGQGYSANGESEHSRQSAHGGSDKRQRLTTPPKWVRGDLTVGELIEKNAKQLAKLNSHILLERDPDRKANIQKQAEIKSRFLARLKSEVQK